MTLSPKTAVMRLDHGPFARPYIRPSAAAVSGFTPQQVVRAYGYTAPVKVLRTPKLGFVSLGGWWAKGDYDACFSKWGLPSPHVTTAGSGNSSDPGGADVENALDLEWLAGVWSAATGSPAEVVGAAMANVGNGIANGIRACVDAGCEVVSISWGAPETGWAPQDVQETEAAVAYAQSKGVWVFAASGDNSLDDGTNTPTCDYPCSSPGIWAVGGTNLRLNSDGSIAAERAWGDGRPGDSGGGGGVSRVFSRPSWQASAQPAGGRGCPDSCLVADPATPYQVYCNSQWMGVGGTSGASPATAALAAVARATLTQNVADLHPLLYANPKCFNDIVVGSNGSPASPGWDESSGLGSWRAADVLSLLSGTGTTSPPPGTPPPTPAPGIKLADVLACDDATAARLIKANPWYKTLLTQVNAQYKSDQRRLFSATAAEMTIDLLQPPAELFQEWLVRKQ
jgi:kumamolisin